jgi:hypothetical protein
MPAEASIYMITYEGQCDGKKGESPYTWTAHTAGQAISLVEELEEQYPNRKWRIEEKDVS